jgi:hypothetical protein
LELPPELLKVDTKRVYDRRVLIAQTSIYVT